MTNKLRSRAKTVAGKSGRHESASARAKRLSAIAHRAVATRRANALAREPSEARPQAHSRPPQTPVVTRSNDSQDMTPAESQELARQLSAIAHKAVATRRANALARENARKHQIKVDAT